MSETRKLTAIVAADVAGYSRLTAADEERTVVRLRGLRTDLIDPAISVHHGRVVKRMGDGILIEFRSVVDAVRCAIEVQNGMVERNAGLPAERQIRFRVGIHLGDVIEEADGDLMGDGVNIAARLEGICEPGAICLSEDAFRQIRSRLDLAITDLGNKELKNIPEPVHVFSLAVGMPAQAKPPTPGISLVAAPRPKNRSMLVSLVGGIAVVIAIAAAAGWYFLARPGGNVAGIAPAHLSIVVLPFMNLSNDPKQGYLADVLTDELTTYISRIPDSFVIARDTAFTYKNKAVDVRQIGKDLGVRYVLEGSVQPTDTRIRTNAQLIDTETGADLWAEAFDTDKTDLLQTEDEIVTRIARTLQIQLSEVEAARLKRAHPANPDARELALQCEATIWNVGPQGPQAEAGFRLCEQALAIDPNDAVALATLPNKFITRALTTGEPSAARQADIKRAADLVTRALAIDPNSADAHVGKSGVLLASGNFDEAKAEAERALALDPGDIQAYLGLCTLNYFGGLAEKLIGCTDKAMLLSPHDPLLFEFMFLKGLAFFMQEKYGPAADWLRKSLALNPHWLSGYVWLAATLAQDGHVDQARDALARFRSMSNNPLLTIAAAKNATNPSSNPVYLAARERMYDGLRKAAMPNQ